MKKIKLKSKAQKPRLQEQWIEVRVRDGKTITEYYPSNKEFDKIIRDADPQPDLIYRRFTFLNGVPTEYLWTNPSPLVAKNGGHFLVRCLPSDWPTLLEAELHTDGHALPTANPQPRPAYFGPCPCQRCTQNRETENRVAHPINPEGPLKEGFQIK